MKHKFFLKTILLSILYSALIFATAPQYIECEGFFPDERLDLFGIPQKTVDSSTILKNHPPVFCNFYSKTHSIQNHQSEDIYLQLFTSELVLSVTLRC
jgi:hypothetical protein